MNLGGVAVIAQQKSKQMTPHMESTILTDPVPAIWAEQGVEFAVPKLMFLGYIYLFFLCPKISNHAKESSKLVEFRPLLCLCVCVGGVQDMGSVMIGSYWEHIDHMIMCKCLFKDCP